ncbi:MAG: hypothetical protein VX833_01345 [Actinomycetota bacterium]|nr:hypothetical protein [Actinomycetota bacterium]
MVRLNALIISVLLALGAGALTVAALLSTGGDTDLTVVSNIAVVELLPARGDEVLPQATVGVILAPGWAGTLVSVGGVVVPLDQQRIEPALNSVVFRPGEGQVLKRLPTQEVCAEVSYWEVQTPDRISFLSWCFRVGG